MRLSQSSATRGQDVEAYYSACVARDGGRAWTTSELKHGKTLAKLCAATAGDHAPIAAAIREQCA